MEGDPGARDRKRCRQPLVHFPVVGASQLPPGDPLCSPCRIPRTSYGLARGPLSPRCGSAEGLEAGRHCLKKWGFRRCEDITWIKTNKEHPNKKLSAVHQDPNSVLVHTKASWQGRYLLTLSFQFLI